MAFLEKKGESQFMFEGVKMNLMKDERGQAAIPLAIAFLAFLFLIAILVGGIAILAKWAMYAFGGFIIGLATTFLGGKVKNRGKGQFKIKRG